MTLPKKQNLNDLYDKFAAKYPYYAGPNKKQLPKAVYPVNIATLINPGDSMSQLPIGEPERSILFGTVTADTSIGIQKNYRNARMQNRHSTRQYTWFFWKWLVALKSFANGLNSMTWQASDGYQVNAPLRDGEFLGKLHINSKAEVRLTEVYKIIAKDGRKFMDRSWLNHMSSYFLMCVWLDDGSLYHSYQGCICLDFSTQHEQGTFCEYLRDAWDIKAYVQTTGEFMADGRERFRIFIADQDSLLKLLRLVAPLVPVEEMLYKVFFVPKHTTPPELLQRWASELKGLVQPEFRSYVENFYEQVINGR